MLYALVVKKSSCNESTGMAQSKKELLSKQKPGDFRAFVFLFILFVSFRFKVTNHKKMVQLLTFFTFVCVIGRLKIFCWQWIIDFNGFARI